MFRVNCRKEKRLPTSLVTMEAYKRKKSYASLHKASKTQF